MINNKFNGDYAAVGGSIYFHDLINNMAGTNSFYFDGLSIQNSIAFNMGGGIYY